MTKNGWFCKHSFSKLKKISQNDKSGPVFFFSWPYWLKSSQNGLIWYNLFKVQEGGRGISTPDLHQPFLSTVPINTNHRHCLFLSVASLPPSYVVGSKKCYTVIFLSNQEPSYMSKKTFCKICASHPSPPPPPPQSGHQNKIMTCQQQHNFVLDTEELWAAVKDWKIKSWKHWKK